MTIQHDDNSEEQQNDTHGSAPTNLLPAKPAPDVPSGMGPEEATAIWKRAAELARQLEESTGSRELETVDSISNVGILAQRAASDELNLLRGRVGEMLSREGAGGVVIRDMADLRMVLNEINPHELGPKGFWERLPGFKRLAPVLERIAMRYEPVCKQITVIESKLREGRSMLAKDNVELRKLYEHVEAQQMPIRKNAYLGEVLMGELEALAERTEDPVKKERIIAVLHDIALRVQDLRTMEAVHEQFFVGIEMTRQNNTRLAQAVERTLTLSTNVLMVGLAIQMALARQKRVMEATKRTREFLGNVIAANAAAIKHHTAEIGDVYNNPVIAVEKIAQAHDDLIEAIETAARLRQEGILTAKENIAKLSQLSGELQEKVVAIQEGAKSVEA